MESRKIVLVTGSNKGIGFGIIQGLLKHKSKLKIALTARNNELGQVSFKQLLKEYPEEKNNLFYHQLDITVEDSIKELFKWIKEKFSKLDYLVNNAGVLGDENNFNVNLFDFTFNANVYGTLSFIKFALKNEILNKNGKLIILGSDWGSLSYLNNKALIDIFKTAKTTEDLLNLANQYRKAIVNNTMTQEGWCKHTYQVSKMIDDIYAKVLSYKAEIINNNISVYSCNPGWVKTDLGGKGAPLSIEEGAKTVLFLLNLPEGIDDKYQEKYFSNCKIFSYY